MLAREAGRDSLGVHREATTHTHSAWPGAKGPCVVTPGGPHRESASSQGSVGAGPPAHLLLTAWRLEQSWGGQSHIELSEGGVSARAAP